VVAFVAVVVREAAVPLVVELVVLAVVAVFVREAAVPSSPRWWSRRSCWTSPRSGSASGAATSTSTRPGAVATLAVLVMLVALAAVATAASDFCAPLCAKIRGPYPRHMANRYAMTDLRAWNRELDVVETEFQALQNRASATLLDPRDILRVTGRAQQIACKFVHLVPTQDPSELDERTITSAAACVMKRANALARRGFELCRKMATSPTAP
jgi:hypothetical protein